MACTVSSELEKFHMCGLYAYMILEAEHASKLKWISITTKTSMRFTNSQAKKPSQKKASLEIAALKEKHNKNKEETVENVWSKCGGDSH